MYNNVIPLVLTNTFNLDETLSGCENVELLFGDVPVPIVDVAVVSEEAHGAVCQQILVEEIPHAGVQQGDLAPHRRQGGRVRVGQVAQLRFHSAAAAAPVTPAGDLLAVGQQL